MNPKEVLAHVLVPSPTSPPMKIPHPIDLFYAFLSYVVHSGILATVVFPLLTYLGVFASAIPNPFLAAFAIGGLKLLTDLANQFLAGPVVPPAPPVKPVA